MQVKVVDFRALLHELRDFFAEKIKELKAHFPANDNRRKYELNDERVEDGRPSNLVEDEQGDFLQLFASYLLDEDIWNLNQRKVEFCRRYERILPIVPSVIRMTMPRRET